MAAQSPRFDFVYDKACEFLLSSGVCSLPVDPYKLIALKNWGLITYTKLCSLVPGKPTIDDIIAACRSSDGFTVASRGNYCIAYNDTVRVKSRIAFTLMHEAGHIVCGHFSGGSSMLSDGEYKTYETEANFFASNVLAPAAVVTSCGLMTAEMLKAACGLSYGAAKLRLNEIMYWKPRPIDDEILKAFDSYIRISLRRQRLNGADIEPDKVAVF